VGDHIESKGQSTLRMGQELPGANFGLFYCMQELHCQAVHGAELRDTIKQTKDCTWQLLASPQYRLALRTTLYIMKRLLNVANLSLKQKLRLLTTLFSTLQKLPFNLFALSAMCGRQEIPTRKYNTRKILQCSKNMDPLEE